MSIKFKLYTIGKINNRITQIFKNYLIIILKIIIQTRSLNILTIFKIYNKIACICMFLFIIDQILYFFDVFVSILFWLKLFITNTGVDIAKCKN